jgi:hypothetical protein
MDLRWSADGRRLYTAGSDGYLNVWDVHREDRSPAALAELERRHGRWRLVGGRLERRP